MPSYTGDSKKGRSNYSRSRPKPKPVGRAIQRQAPKRKPTKAPSTHDVGVTSPKPRSTLGGQKVPKRTKRKAKPVGQAIERGARREQRRQAAQNKARSRARARRIGASLGSKADTDKKILGVNVEAELEGRGLVSRAAEKAKKVATSDLGQRGLRSAGVIPAGTPERVSKNFSKDVVDFAAQSIPGVYAAGAGAVEAVQGRPERGKELLEQVKDHDPVALTLQGRFKEAAKEAEKHPGLTALSAYGAGSAVSRTAGVAARTGGKMGSKRLRRIGNTKRAPKVAPGTGLEEGRTWSRGLGAKAIQVTIERAQSRNARKLREKAKKTKDPQKKKELRAAADNADPRVMSASEIRRRTNELEHTGEVRRRARIQRAAKKGRETLPKDKKRTGIRKRLTTRPGREIPKDHRAAVALLVSQKIVEPTRKSLQAYKRQIDAEAKRLDGSQLRANRTLSRQIQAALNDKGLDFDEVVASAEQYREGIEPLQAGLVERGILDPGQERMAKLIPYAVQEMKARWDGDGLVIGTKDGKVPVTADMIEGHMREHRAGVPAFVTQAPRSTGARNWYASWHDPKGIGHKQRTGEATRKGIMAVGRDVAVEAFTRAEGLAAAFDTYSRWIGENAYRGERGKGKVADHTFDTRGAAWDKIENDLADSPYEWTVVATRPRFGPKAQTERLLDKAEQADPREQMHIGEGIQKALDGDGDGPYVIVPKTAQKTMRNHAGVTATPGIKMMRNIGRQFSGTVLTTQGFAWPMGNVTEGLLRLAVMRAGPASLVLAHKTVRELRKIDPDMADEFEAGVGTGHLGAFEMQRTYTTARDLNDTRVAGPVARGLSSAARAPGPKQAGQLWGGWTKAIFGGNGFIEHQLRLTAAGKHLRTQHARANWLRDGHKAMQVAAEQAAKGMKGTPEQIAAGRFVDRAMGRYGKWSPETRLAVAAFTPFAAWAVNAAKFFVDVLPRDHPILTGLLASTERATEEWRNSYGLGQFIDGAAPDWLQPSIPTGKAGTQDAKLFPIGRYTPAGAFANPLETFSGQILPQWRAIQNAAFGLDWKGDPLGDYATPDDVPQDVRVKAIGEAIGGAMIPFFGLYGRVDEGGPGALNPVKGYQSNQDLGAAFDMREEAERAKESLPKDSPAYRREHMRWRRAQERIFRESEREYGQRFKEPYEPEGGSNPFSGSSGGGGGENPFQDSGGSSSPNPFK